MAANIEDFVKRLIRTNRKITFVLTEDFFQVTGVHGMNTERFRDIRNVVKNVFHRKGSKAASAATDETALFDVEVAIVGTDYQCAITDFSQLADGPFGRGAVISGYDQDMIDPIKAKYQVDSFFTDIRGGRISVTKMMADRKRRQLVLVVDRIGDLKRPSLEKFRELRHKLYTILISPEKGPIVDCQVNKLFQEGNSNSFSNLMNMFCVEY